ncbi:kynureninase 1 [Nemania sp. NC0429]|nr:kynureninase 1 [Nemania sp. NC0429]
MTSPVDAARFSGLRAQAEVLDGEDGLRHLRGEFHIPTKADVHRKTLRAAELPVERSSDAHVDETTPCTYLCGNSLGLQPKRTAARIQQYLTTWATQGVQGHFKPLEDSPLPTWLDVDDRAAQMMAPIVGADETEVAVMQTLTANLHLLMSAFYRPDPNGRHKIILESKAFPSDHFAVLSQIRHHGLSPETSMVTIESPFAEDSAISTYDIQSVISKHAADTALILLPGVQYYTGQLLDIPTITAYARRHGIFIIWDLAHAAGNVPLSLHDWDVDAAAWCTYKYLNGGPGCIGGAFIHARNSSATAPTAAEEEEKPEQAFSDRLSGWWGNDKRTRFQMETKFEPVRGAAGFQLSNPSVLDMTSLCASLEVFALAGGMAPLREKSRRLTAFLEQCLSLVSDDAKALFRNITPPDPAQRGAQLSLLLKDGLLAGTMRGLEERGVIVDERKPDVVRVAPAPLYNSFQDCVSFVEAFEAALFDAKKAKS